MHSTNGVSSSLSSRGTITGTGIVFSQVSVSVGGIISSKTGAPEGAGLGAEEGLVVGAAVGDALGWQEGVPVRSKLVAFVCVAEGNSLGALVGDSEGGIGSE